nr:MAG TPA: hypothetical protein [Microviridae sp.]
MSRFVLSRFVPSRFDRCFQVFHIISIRIVAIHFVYFALKVDCVLHVAAVRTGSCSLQKVDSQAVMLSLLLLFNII